MKIEYDNFVTTGATHNICEDACLAGETDKYVYAVVCDGCSASENSHIGANLLVHFVKMFVLYNNTSIDDFNLDIEFKIRLASEMLDIDYSCFDSTILFARYDKKTNHLDIVGYGDGVIVLNNTFFQLEFEHNAPYYFSYLLDKDRKELYHEQFPNQKLYSNGKEQPDNIFVKNLNDYRLDRLLLFSDGINSFDDNNGILYEALNFKSYNGKFINRKLNKLLREQNKKNNRHFDDISCAGFHIDYEEDNVSK